MRVLIFSFLVLPFSIEAFNSHGLRNERSASDEAFEKKLEAGYQLLKDQPNADDTRRLLQQLHNMEDEIKEELTLSPERNAEIQNEMKDYVKVENDHIESAGDTIEEANELSKVDSALFQGDILLTKEQADEIIEDVRDKEGNRKKRQAYRDSVYPRTLWSNGVYYSFHWNATSGARRVFKKAADIWQMETCIDFHEDNSAPSRIVVFQGPGCYSNVGRIGRLQVMSLGPRCEWVGIAVHELGHSLGFYHTQSRHDRDDFITLYLENFREGWISQFNKQSEQTNYNYNITYDYGSVMHYGATVVSRNGQPVMVPRDMKYMQTMGSHILSFYEKLMMNLHYGCLDRCKGSSSAACQNGGFPHPRDCSKCTCPSGYGGRLCNERPSGCGKILTATKSYQTLEDTIGEKGARYARDAYMMCNYWIQGPPGSTIEVVLDNYSTGVAKDGCYLAGVEIKTLSDKRYTGYRFCSPRYAGTTLVSTHNVVPVITYSRVIETTTVLRYRIASSGSEPSETTSKPTEEETTTKPTDKPDSRCKDTNICPTVLKWDFCNSDYDDEMKKLVCAKSCRFC